MAILKCKMCGGDIELSADKTFGTCESCGCTMTFPKVDDEQRANAFNRGNHFRRMGEFDKALAVYERIVQEDENDAEAHWCCALCRFGIEYVEDPNTFEYLPTCHRASFDSFLEDVDYLAAVEHSDGVTRRQYQKDAAKIAEVQRGILATSQNEEPFDVFICYKESENDGTRTRDSLLAQEIYYQLTEQGRRVFFSRITLEDKAGTEYEPYIFAALNSAKVMIVVTTSAEHVNAVWVKNEWSRFLSLMRKDRTKLLLPCYRDMDPYDLPEALSVLQSYDMSKIGFIQDLIRGVNKVLDASAPKAKETIKETVVVQQANTNAAPLLKRAFMFLEDGDFARADEFCEKVLNLDPENGEAYLGKLMAELHVKTRDALKDQPEPFDNRNNYKKAYRFGDEKLKTKLSGNIAFINERNENARKTRIYNDGVKAMNAASTESTYKKAAEAFKTIPGFRDADALAKRCLEQAEICRKDAIYQSAYSKMNGFGAYGYNSAIKTFKTIPGWKDSEDQILVCQRKIEEIKAKEAAERMEREHRIEQRRIKVKKRKRIIAIVTLIAVACIAFVIVLTTVIIPNQKYNAAVELYNAGKYEDAIAAFTALDGYKDSAAQIEKCETAIRDEKYAGAVELYTAGKYEEAIAAFTALVGYKDSAAQIKKCETSIKDEKYSTAMELYNSGKYEEATILFQSLGDYLDSSKMINKCSIRTARVGDSVIFGRYNNKDLTWWVLYEKDGKLTLLCSESVASMAFGKDKTWESSSIRSWLNNNFYNSAFDTAEKHQLLKTEVSTWTWSYEIQGNTANRVEEKETITSDSVYILSENEFRDYSVDSYKLNTDTWWTRSACYYSKATNNLHYWCVNNNKLEYIHNGSHLLGDEQLNVIPVICIDSRNS